MKPLKILKQLDSIESDVVNHMFISVHDWSASNSEYFEFFKQYGIVFIRTRDDYNLSLYFIDQESCDNFMMMVADHGTAISPGYFNEYDADSLESVYQKLYDGIFDGSIGSAYISCLPSAKRKQISIRARRDDTNDIEGITVYPIDTNIEPDPANEYYAG